MNTYEAKSRLLDLLNADVPESDAPAYWDDDGTLIWVQDGAAFRINPELIPLSEAVSESD